jgi:hypothetical protein
MQTLGVTAHNHSSFSQEMAQAFQLKIKRQILVRRNCLRTSLVLDAGVSYG